MGTVWVVTIHGVLLTFSRQVAGMQDFPHRNANSTLMEKHRLFLARAEPEAEWTNLPQEPLLFLLFHPVTSKMLLMPRGQLLGQTPDCHLSNIL